MKLHIKERIKERRLARKDRHKYRIGLPRYMFYSLHIFFSVTLFGLSWMILDMSFRAFDTLSLPQVQKMLTPSKFFANIGENMVVGCLGAVLVAVSSYYILAHMNWSYRKYEVHQAQEIADQQLVKKVGKQERKKRDTL